MNIDPSAFAWFTSLAGREGKKYSLLRYIDHGNIGFVYEARSLEVPDWPIVLKLVPAARLECNPHWINEIRKVSKLSTIAGVVHYHGLGTGDDEFGELDHKFTYTVWDYIPPGQSLTAFLEKHAEEVRTSFLIGVVEEILRVVHACKAKGVDRHGDLHPGNILIGEQDGSVLDGSLQPRLPVYVSDFGYGATGIGRQPRDDYEGLAEIFDITAAKIDWDRSTPLDRHTVLGIRDLLQKLLKEPAQGERRTPLEILEAFRDVKSTYRQRPVSGASPMGSRHSAGSAARDDESFRVGQFQVSEMLGERWELWKKLFVSAVPARSRILGTDINIVLTGPRGCGKTMLFRRLSARLIVECGRPDDADDEDSFVGIYVNANDIADAFPNFPENPTVIDAARLICYTNLCILSDVLAVESSRQLNDAAYSAPLSLLRLAAPWLVRASEQQPLVVGENPLEEMRLRLERVKWEFARPESQNVFPGYDDLSRITWLPAFVAAARRACEWIGKKPVYILVDDYTTPHVSFAMQRVLNRLLFQRSSASSEFVCKIATESATTFVAEDSSGKILQDGDDYQLIDIGEESLFMKEVERQGFLDRIFRRRLAADRRIPEEARDLKGLLGILGMSKTEFARRLRAVAAQPVEGTGIDRRGAVKPSVLYKGADVLAGLWSGDTRIMIQLIQELLHAADSDTVSGASFPVRPEIQDRVLRDRGATWLEAQTRNLPSDQQTVSKEIARIRESEPAFDLAGGTYGAHLKAIVEAFTSAARNALFGPPYMIGRREVPKTAFRIEVVDEFRLNPLAREIYKDLIRYGVFLRDARGKSVRGAMVPRLYLRRLLLPYCTLALSKRDSLQMDCEVFNLLLLRPDVFRTTFPEPRTRTARSSEVGQLRMEFLNETSLSDPAYDDLDENESEDDRRKNGLASKNPGAQGDE
jgi:hypothetical protein